MKVFDSAHVSHCTLSCDRLGRTGWVYIVTFVALLPLIILRDFTPDNELRYLSIADEALHNGSLWCFTNHGAIYADKPPLYLWLVMLCRLIFGAHLMPVLALLSLVPMFIIGRVMDRWAAASLELHQRQMALLILFTCGYFPLLGVTLRMDMLFTMWITLAIREVWRLAQGADTRHGLLLGLYLFMALFTKGPLGVAIPLLATIVWSLWQRRPGLMRHCWNIYAWLVLLAGCACWFSGVYYEGGTQYLDNLLFHQTIDRAHNAFHHRRPFYYYAVCIWYVLAPWSLFMAWRWLRRPQLMCRDALDKLLLCIIIPTFLLLSCISSKLQVYLLPIIAPAVWLYVRGGVSHKLFITVKWVASALLLALFVAGFLSSRLETYGPVVRRALDTHPRKILVDRSVRRGENIDAYTGDIPVDTVSRTARGFTLSRGETLIYRDDTGLQIITYGGSVKK